MEDLFFYCGMRKKQESETFSLFSLLHMASRRNEPSPFLHSIYENKDHTFDLLHHSMELLCERLGSAVDVAVVGSIGAVGVSTSHEQRRSFMLSQCTE